MKIKLVAYGIAKDILKAREMEWEFQQPSVTVQLVKESLLKDYPAFANLRKLSLAVGIEYRDDSYELKDGDEVIIIPPVSGG